MALISLFKLQKLHNKIKQVKTDAIREIGYWFSSFQYEEVLVLGDSHAVVFNNPVFRKEFPNCYFRVISIGGATVSGLKNPNSVTQAMPRFKKGLERSQAKKVVILLGEVDTGFVIWHRACKYNESVTEMLNIAAESYQKFLAHVNKVKQVVCISTPLPTIKDGENKGVVANLRKEIVASQLERTELTIEFNRIIESFCKTNKIAYLSLDKVSLGQDGLVCKKLLNNDIYDHHYNGKRYSELIASELKTIL